MKLEDVQNPPFIGTTIYNDQDRGAILNILNKLTVYYDEHDLDSYVNCYADGGAFIRYGYDFDTKKFEENLDLPKDEMKKYFGDAIAKFVAEGKQTRHIGSAYTVDQQDGLTAKANFYVLLTNTQNYTTLTMMLTAFYHADMVKVGQDWKIKTLTVYIDSALNR